MSARTRKHPVGRPPLILPPTLVAGGAKRLDGVECWLTPASDCIHVLATAGGRPTRHLGTINDRDELRALVAAEGPGLAAELTAAERKAERAALRKSASRQSIPHNFHDFLSARYAPVRRVTVSELAARLEAEFEPEPQPGAGVGMRPWAVVSKGVGGGWHGTTALDTRTGTLYAVWTRYGTATLWRGIARARPRAVLYLERSERLRADGSVSSRVD